MNTDGNAEGDFNTDIKDGNVVDENVDDATMTLAEMRIKRYECANYMDNNGNTDADIGNDDYAEDDSTEGINDVDAVSNGMDTDGNVEVDIDTENGDEIDDIKDEDGNVNNDNDDEAQSFISKEKVIDQVSTLPSV